MRYSFLFLLTLLLILVFSCDTSERLVINNVSTINLDNGQTEIKNIVVKNGIIQKITSDPLRTSNSNDLNGNLILPPLWDMHAHLHDSAHIKMGNFIKNGIFGIRDMGIFKGNNSNFLSEYSNNINRENTDYTIIPVGYIYNGSECEVEEHQSINSRSNLIEAISLIKAANLNYFKIHNCFPMSLMEDLVELCKENDIKIVGHIPAGIDPLEFTEYGISSIEHMDSFLRGLFSKKINPAKTFDEAINILDGSYLDSLAINMKANNIYLTPTLVTYENFVKSFPDDQQESGMVILNRLQNYTKRLWEKGVKILPGTDYPLGNLKAGESLIRELELLVEAGIPLNEVVKIATHYPLEYLGMNNYHIDEGSPANFIILESDEINLDSFNKIQSAVIEGKYISF